MTKPLIHHYSIIYYFCECIRQSGLTNQSNKYTNYKQYTSECNTNNIYGVFVMKTVVCEGYAKAFQYLLNLSGIDNIFVAGSSHGVGHAWNCVYINGN